MLSHNINMKTKSYYLLMPSLVLVLLKIISTVNGITNWACPTAYPERAKQAAAFLQKTTASSDLNSRNLRHAFMLWIYNPKVLSHWWCVCKILRKDFFNTHTHTMILQYLIPAVFVGKGRGMAQAANSHLIYGHRHSRRGEDMNRELKKSHPKCQAVLEEWQKTDSLSFWLCKSFALIQNKINKLSHFSGTLSPPSGQTDSVKKSNWENTFKARRIPSFCW